MRSELIDAFLAEDDTGRLRLHYRLPVSLRHDLFRAIPLPDRLRLFAGYLALALVSFYRALLGWTHDPERPPDLLSSVEHLCANPFSALAVALNAAFLFREIIEAPPPGVHFPPPRSLPASNSATP